MELKDLIGKYLDNNITPEEEKEVVKIMTSARYSKEVQKYMQQDWFEFKNEKGRITAELKSILEKIHHQIRIDEGERRRGLKRKMNNWYVRAAIMIFPLLLLAAIYILKGTMFGTPSVLVIVEAPNDRFLNFDLPDGTCGVLKNGAQLSYEEPFVSDRRLVLKGEAYFNVAHDIEHPFTVMTHLVKVSVLGTKFGIKAYEGEDLADVLLEEGKVKCEVVTHDKDVILEPNEQLSVANGQVAVTKENVKELLSWKDGLLIFRNDRMIDVVDKLERWYNVNITIKNEQLYTYSFRATFKNEPIEEVLTMLSKTSPLKFKVKEHEVAADNQSLKKQIILYN